ncbi:MAG: hypothetical protein QOG62_2834 [Thermoleophilaceae bacterium]|nr:hypothetical protein [Thermoleophilaceae bacterium]
MDRAIDATATEQARVGGVDDGVRLGILRDVATVERDAGTSAHAQPRRTGADLVLVIGAVGFAVFRVAAIGLGLRGEGRVSRARRGVLV